VEKVMLDQLLRRIRSGRVTVQYWDGTTTTYGKTGEQLGVAIKRPAVVRRMLRSPTMAFGEGYMQGDIEITAGGLDVLFRLQTANRAALIHLKPVRLYRHERNRRGRQQSQISHHYDVGNAYYRLFLDETLSYSCAYFHKASDTLEQAQHQKIDHVLRKLRLQKGQRLLDIGSGWGYLAVAAAKRYDATVLGVTLSEEQLAGARELAEREGVADKVRFELTNYQDLPAGEPFDRIVSVGMFEHVGRGNHATYFKKVRELLTDDGLSVLHTITNVEDEVIDPWIDRYVFPGGYLPTISEIEGHLEALGLWSIDRENLWQHYAMTLNAWRQRHERHRKKIIDMYDEVFYRMRELWLAGSEAGFAHGDLGLAQVVFTKHKPAMGTWPLTREYLYKD
jgi:cyclopropane-fatty-acyl-phospholipid synthase